MEIERINRLNTQKLGIEKLLNLDSCAKCGECISLCPVFDTTDILSLTPREKIKIFKKIIKRQSGLLSLITNKTTDQKLINEFKEYLYRCSICGQCREVCPANIDTIELWEKIRMCFVESGYGPLEKQMAIVNGIKNYDNPWMQPRNIRRRWADRAFREGRLTKPIKDIMKDRTGILYYVGCTASYDQNIKEVAINFAELMNRAGIDFGILGEREKCCGSTPLRIGAEDVFLKQAVENVKLFNELGVHTVVFSCSGCFKTMHQDYPNVMKAKFRTVHLVQFINELLETRRIIPEKEVNIKVTYHDPCHLGRHNKIYDEPRKILKMIPGVELIEMERTRERSRCCGAGGGVRAGFPETQTAMSDKRVRDAEATGANEFVTACPFCYQSLKDGITRTGSSLIMRDITEILVQSI